MKTLREQYIEKIKTYDDPEGGLSDPAQIKHLLWLCDMLDERERGTNEIGATATAAIFDATNAELEAHGLHASASAEPTAEAPTHCSFDDAFLDRLARVSWDAQMQDEAIRAQCPTWENYPEQFKKAGLVGLKAILAELAKVPVELPRWQVWQVVACGSDVDTNARHIDGYLRAQVAPILAAKDARIALLEQDQEEKMMVARHYIIELEKRSSELESSHSATVEAMQAALSMTKQDLETVIRREAELHVMLGNYALPTEPKALARELSGRQAAVEEIVHERHELEKRLAERDAQYETLLRCKDAMGIPRDAFCDLPARIALLKTNSVPSTIDGKTPGQVCFAAFDPNLAQFGSRVPEDWERAARAVLAAFGDNAIARSAQDCMPGDVLYEAHKFVDDNFPDESNAKRYNMAALAVLRAFGQPSQTPQTTAMEALRRVWERIDGLEKFSVMDGDCPISVISIADVRLEIDELAKLSAEPPNNVTTPKFFANENVLRGSYFCGDLSLYPYLDIGRNIEFSDIPRVLKLGRNDVIEVRVVERAKP